MELFAGLDRLRREGHGFESGAANLVDRHGTHFRRQSAVDRGLARGILPQSGGNHIAHDAFVHLRRVEAGALHRLADHDGAELRCAEIRQASLKFSYRRATAGDDYDFVFSGHLCAPAMIFSLQL